MSAVASEAGVATGTAYVHYESKEDLVLATYLDVKTELGEAVLVGYDADAPPAERYRHLVFRAYEHMAAEPERARFLTQMEESPFYASAHERLLERGDRLAEEATRPDLVELLVPLPPQVIYSMSLGVVVRLVAGGSTLSDEELETLVASTWRAITVPG
jgi:TetR/AcrR family transcriptional repressor of multidrug resistance operon